MYGGLLANYADAISVAADTDVSRRSVTFDWEDIRECDEDVAESLFTEPSRTRGGLAQAIHDEYDVEDVTVRIGNIPSRHTYRVGKYRTPDLGTLIGVEGEVVSAKAVEPFAKRAALVCVRCGTTMKLRQTFGRMDEPAECFGCEHSNPGYKFDRAQSEIIDYREVTLIPAESNLEDPPMLTATLKEDLVDNIGPGDVATLIGVYDTAQTQSKATLQTYLDVWTVEGVEAAETDKLSAAELDQLIVERTESQQSQSDGTFGVAEADIVTSIVDDEGVRQTEVEKRVSALKEANEIHEVGGGKIMAS